MKYIYHIFLITYSELKDELKEFIAGNLAAPLCKTKPEEFAFSYTLYSSALFKSQNPLTKIGPSQCTDL